MRVLGLDLSLTASGAVILEGGKAVEPFLISTQASVPDVERFAYIAGSVIGMCFDQVTGECEVDLVAIEGVYASKNAMIFGRLSRLAGIVEFSLYRSRIQYVVYPPASWRKILFGPGSKVDKERVRVAVAQRLKEHLGTLNVEKVDLNVLEAFCVALAAQRAVDNPSLAPVPKPKRARRPVAVG